MNALALDELEVRYGTTVAVDRVSLTVRSQEVTALVGPSGCGKTSLLRAVAGFEKPARGSVCIDGRAVAGNGAWVAPEQRRIGMVFQEGALFPHLTVRDNVRYGVGRDPAGADRAAATIELVGLERLVERFPHELSGGQQQLVALARALAPSPKLVLLDEPFANLDASLRSRLRDRVRAILDTARMTAVLVTHDQNEALSVGDRLAVMVGGRLLQTGQPQDVYDGPQTVEVAEFIGGGQLLPGSAGSGRLSTVLGSLRTDAPDGAARLLVRAEDVRVLPGSAAEGTPGRITRRRFHGHDRLDEVALEDGCRVLVRRLTPEADSGDRVRLALRGKRYRVFSAPNNAAHTAW